MGRSWQRWIRPPMVAAVAVLAIRAFSADPPAEARRPAATEAGRPVLINVDIGRPGDGGRRAAYVLAGSELVVLATAAPDSKPSWQLGYSGTVLCQGHVPLDADGRGKLRIKLPDVRHRTQCELTLKAPGQTGARRVTILPAAVLSQSARHLARLRLGIVDPTGSVQKALGGQGVEAAALETQYAEDFFHGGAAVLAGFKDAGQLAFKCRRLEGRLREGMSLLIVNPPPGWSGWGARPAEPGAPATASAAFAANFGRFVLPGDLGTGPWPRYLEAPPGAEPLIWFAPPQLAATQPQLTATRPHLTATAPSAPPRRPVVAAVRVGKGLLVVTAVPQMDDPVDDPVGRTTFNEIVLWILRWHHERQDKEH